MIPMRITTSMSTVVIRRRLRMTMNHLPLAIAAIRLMIHTHLAYWMIRGWY